MILSHAGFPGGGGGEWTDCRRGVLNAAWQSPQQATSGAGKEISYLWG